MFKTRLRLLSPVVLAILTLAIAAVAQTSPTEFKGIKIKNFGQIDEHYYRGAQPEKDDFQSLATLGVKTIVDLRSDPVDYEKSSAEAVGIKYINIPMSGVSTPRDADVEQFLALVNDPATGTIYVHCKAGIHRTGVMAAVYRISKYGWDYDKAYQEMKNYDFSPGLVHGSFRDYVKDYSTRPNSHKAVAAVIPAAATAN